MVRKKHYRDKENGINFFDFLPSKVKPFLIGGSFLTAIFSVTGNILAVSGDDNHVSLWRESPDRSWNCISDEQAAQ